MGMLRFSLLRNTEAMTGFSLAVTASFWIMEAMVTASVSVSPRSGQRSLYSSGTASWKRFTILDMISREVMWGARKYVSGTESPPWRVRPP